MSTMTAFHAGQVNHGLAVGGIWLGVPAKRASNQDSGAARRLPTLVAPAAPGGAVLEGPWPAGMLSAYAIRWAHMSAYLQAFCRHPRRMPQLPPAGQAAPVAGRSERCWRCRSWGRARARGQRGAAALCSRWALCRTTCRGAAPLSAMVSTHAELASAIQRQLGGAASDWLITRSLAAPVPESSGRASAATAAACACAGPSSSCPAALNRGHGGSGSWCARMRLTGGRCSSAYRWGRPPLPKPCSSNKLPGGGDHTARVLQVPPWYHALHCTAQF